MERLCGGKPSVFQISIDTSAKQLRALITGASAGLGAEFAEQLASRGYDLVLVARRRDALATLAESLRKKYKVCITLLIADLSESNAVDAITKEIEDSALSVDYLVNNAGSSGPDFLRDRDWRSQRQYFELMMMSVAGLCHFFVPRMRAQGKGRVINVASVAGAVSMPGDCSYGPTKAYLIALSKGLSATLQGSNVNVLALCPGFTHTDFHVAPDLQRMKESTPKFIWYDASVVVTEALLAVERKKSVLYSGRLYRFLMPILRSRFGAFFAARMGVKRDY